MGNRGTITRQLIEALSPGNQELRAILESLDEDIDNSYTEDDVTAGTVAASKVVQVDANKDIGDFRNLDAVNIDAGASGTAGSVDVFPTTASKGKLTITCTDQTGNTTVGLVAGAMGQGTTITIPDPGAATANVLLSAGAQTIAGTKTFSGDIVASAVKTTTSVGTANTGVTAVEYGDGVVHRTKLTINQAAAFTLAVAAAIADGYKIYDFPAGDIVVLSAIASLTVTNAEHNTEAFDLGIGTTIGTGAVATLDGTPGFEDIMTGQTAAIGTVEFAAVNTPLAIATGDSHAVHVNLAATWANTAGAALDADLAGTVYLEWVKV